MLFAINPISIPITELTDMTRISSKKYTTIFLGGFALNSTGETMNIITETINMCIKADRKEVINIIGDVERFV